MRRAPVIITLVVLAPTIAELSIGDLPFDLTGLVSLLFVTPIYGAGAVLVRELVRRGGRGWPSILLLGVAYGLVEEGIGLQSLFSPTIYHAIGPAWGARLFGLNGAYTEFQVVNHPVWSIALPILFTDLIFPGQRHRPLLGRVGIVVTSFGYVLGVGATASTRLTIDPGYAAPAAALVGVLLVVVVLGVVALALLPRVGDGRSDGGTVPTPRALLALGAVGGFCCLGLVYVPGHLHLAFMSTPLVALPMAATVALAVAGLVLVRRWAARSGWTDGHALGLGAGLAVGHALIGVLFQPRTLPDHVGAAVVLLVGVALLSLLARRVRNRPRPAVVTPQ